MPSWKKVITSGSNASLNSLNITTSLTASGLIYPAADGIDGQVLKTDGLGNLFFENTTTTTISIKNVSGGTITKGTPCYITGSGTSGNVAGVWPADASNPLRMPAGVIAGETLNNGDEGIGLINGFINGVNTSTFAGGDSVYVAVGGGYTNVRPTGSAVLVQKLGNVEKSAINGSGVINGPGYYNDLPNVQSGYIWVGNSNGVATAIATSSIQNVVSASFASTASSVNTLNQNVLISGSLTVGATTAGASENTLTLGPKGTQEGGQLLFQAGTSYTSASMLDMYQDSSNPYFRLLRGSNVGSDAVVAQWNTHTKQMFLPAYNSPTAFTSTPLVGLLGFDSNGALITTTTSSGGGGGGVTITNNVDNYVITATGTANTLNGESNLQFNGTSLTVTGQITSSGAIISQANGAMYFRGGDDAEFWDINVANTVGIYGQQTQTVAGLKLGSAGATLYGSGSRFGIGTTTPVATLDVNGNLYVASGITSSLQGTASYSTQALSSSFASTASYVNQLNQIVRVGNDIELDNQIGAIVANSFDAGLGNVFIDGTSGDVAATSFTAGGGAVQIDGITGEVTATTFIGNLNGTASYATQALSASYAPSTPTFPYTGSATVSGSLVVTGSLLITGSSTLINQGPTILSGSFKVQGEGDGVGGPITTAITVDDINFTRKLHDSQTGSGSLDFANRDLLDANGNGAFNWNGVAATIDSRLYINQTVSATVRNQLLTNVGVGGQLLNGVAFDSLVQTNDLVYLANDGVWYQVDQATDSSTRMLGICMEYDPMTYIGKVLLEGDVIVSTGPGYPAVAGAAYGSPVYIKEGAGTAMSTTVPVNDYVRLLGYCYHEAGGTEWIMKFRPSNEWIQL